MAGRICGRQRRQALSFTPELWPSSRQQQPAGRGPPAPAPRSCDSSPQGRQNGGHCPQGGRQMAARAASRARSGLQRQRPAKELPSQ